MIGPNEVHIVQQLNRDADTLQYLEDIGLSSSSIIKWFC